MSRPLFSLGKIVGTPACLGEFNVSGESIIPYISRHVTGDWSDMSFEDQLANRRALKDGSRVFSSYRMMSGVVIWIITAAVDEKGEREHTALLLPEDY